MDRPLVALIDYKSGRSVHADSALQLAGYRHADSYVALPDTSAEPVPEVDVAFVLHLRPRSYQLVPVDTSEHVYQTLLYAREVYRWITETSRDVLGQRVARSRGGND